MTVCEKNKHPCKKNGLVKLDKISTNKHIAIVAKGIGYKGYRFVKPNFARLCQTIFLTRIPLTFFSECGGTQ